MQKEKYNVLIVSGKPGMDHDPQVSEWLRTMLESCGKFNVDITEAFRGASQEMLEDYDALLVNYFVMSKEHGFMGWGDTSEKTVIDFVKSGKGIVFYHASVFYDQTKAGGEFHKMIGIDFSREAGFRKSPKLDMVVNFADDCEITKGIQARHWGTPCDDLFVPGKILPEAENLKIIATVYDGVEDYDTDLMQKHILQSYYENGGFASLPNINQEQPVVWTNSFGDGRVFCVSIGHGPDTIRRPPFVAMMVRGVEWVCSGECTIDPPDLQYENRFRIWPYYLDINYHEEARLLKF